MVNGINTFDAFAGVDNRFSQGATLTGNLLDIGDALGKTKSWQMTFFDATMYAVDKYGK